jgi:lipoate-protein ligase B
MSAAGPVSVATEFERRVDAGSGASIRDLGRTDYETTWRAMQSFTSAREANTRDEIWRTEHPPIYTLGGRRRGTCCAQWDSGD